jgi:purine-nucleoside phosphorylase
MKEIVKKMNKARDHIRSKSNTVPLVGIVLGTGLGALANEITAEALIPYGEIPGFVSSTVESHEGKLIIGELSGKKIIAMQGRFHLYEGFTMQEITFPVRVMKALGVSNLIISNAAGGMNPSFHKGDLVLIKDHINLLGDNPLIDVNAPELGPRFPDMGEPYSKRLASLAKEAAFRNEVTLHEGIYVAVPGPSLETRAEYRFLRMIGADMVGMSTVPETIVAVQMGIEVLGITIISDMCIPESLEFADIQDIIRTCVGTEPKLTCVIKEVVGKI